MQIHAKWWQPHSEFNDILMTAILLPHSWDTKIIHASQRASIPHKECMCEQTDERLCVGKRF